MLLFSFLVLVYATLAAATSCKVRGQVNNYFDCFRCPALACGYKVRTFITPGLKRDVSCLWTDGENYRGINDWYYVPNDKCYIWGGRIDAKNCKLSKLPKCEPCTPIIGQPIAVPTDLPPPAAAAAPAAAPGGSGPGGRREFVA
ncbi:uncharacterized protein BO97DRAFT_451251 [Aspergillus homomorphus CBS 101889]|uniref:Secreted protein n=1 Tax=Aspergillus homomorphus (strain CBS 101889) TaxID=1450537 RepID=A0A395HYP7_ASPHC|nr:hypothetical protein BO97DRAFT_451251 [Aspergillus homomorphus CBS 101889]RAL12656.1 hypothetical protein BO97DRAFT_451251 [Aspergillus homomorphus CBS 101889]